ncbi:MAG: DUF1707 domain-containing protein [Cumulibacter sp.]
MTTERPIDPQQMRVGHADREEMVKRLSRAHTLGQLQLDEFDTRTQLAYDARVRGDLDALVVDLPVEGDRNPRADSAARAGGGRPGGGPGCRSRHPGVNRAEWRTHAERLQRHPNRVWIIIGILGALWLIGGVVGGPFGFVGGVLRGIMTVLLVVGIVTLVRRVRGRH